VTATIRGRVWRAPRIDVSTWTDRAPRYIPAGWVYEVRADGRLVIRDHAGSQRAAFNAACRHIRLAAEIANLSAATPQVTP
jgi:hypothetical protein